MPEPFLPSLTDLPYADVYPQLWSRLLAMSPVGYVLVRADDGQFIEVNHAFCELTGYTREELLAKRTADISTQDSQAADQQQRDELAAAGEYRSYEKRYHCKTGEVILVRLKGCLVVGPAGERWVLSVVEDITHEKANAHQLHLLAKVFEGNHDAILITDAHNRIVAVNRAFTTMTGYDAEDVLGQDPHMLASGRTAVEDYAKMWQHLQEKGAWQGEICDRRKDGSLFIKWMSVSVVYDTYGKPANYIASFTDITERHEIAERLNHMAHHDSLTGLPNRAALLSQLEHALACAGRAGTQVAVLFIDMDRFKTVNDTLGHQIGDELLIAVAKRLRECLRASDIVARLGGDEFVVVLPEVQQALNVATIAGKIQRNLADSYRIRQHDLYSTPSIGVSLYPSDGLDVETLMKNADTAMYHAKNQGRNNYQFFAHTMNEAAHERLRLENALHRALESTTLGSNDAAHGELRLYFQPQWHLKTGKVVSLEALARWTHPEMGIIPPAKFIPIAEETGLIMPLGDWVFWEACRQLRQFQNAGLKNVRMAVNLSAQQLRQESLSAVVMGALACYELQPQDLELEITEHVAMQNPAATVKVLQELQGMGIVLSIDDFGTGYSSLTYLKYLPIQRLKLDRSFIKDMELDSDDAAICSATITLGHNLGLEMVAEGVETEEQRAMLQDQQCDVIQGFLYCPPLPPDQLMAFLSEHHLV